MGVGDARVAGVGAALRTWECQVEPFPGDMGTALVRLAGELDVAALPQLRDILEKAGCQATKVRVDLSSVTFLDAGVVGALLAARSAIGSRGVRLVAVGACGMPARVVQLCGAEHVLEDERTIP
jgi:anti-anti-sigma factor